ncbi:MAG: ABC transporter ATP-binding protein [Treponema sp.]|nr:ABC transporter ATP-binding protein [Treponema sp.]MBR1714901.1 ABC transporter ATP-binding protein [Treponema sp.]
MAIIELKNVSKIYQMEKVQVKAVDNASFTIEKGEFAAISGPSGSGKSTLLNMIGLIDLPASGSIIIEGIDVYDGIKLGIDAKVPLKLDTKLTELRRSHLGFIFQTFNLIPVLDVWENVELPLSLGKSVASTTLNSAQRKEWIEFLLETVGLTKWKNHKPSELSGGQRQRVAIARALVTKAPIILADEPTANLDSKNGDQILELMKKLSSDMGTTFVFSTHDAKIVAMSDHVIKIRDGIITE